MAVLSSKQILLDKQTSDPTTITALALNHKALTDVSCLSDFKNLERLDLGFNNLSSLEGLKLCTNLKWLSVVQNKLLNLKGVEGLTKLTVLNAGKNKLRSMDEVRSIFSLRALILNDNEIASIPRLDQMKELNTLVLSRNPIREIGESLAKVKSITKLSLSNCQLQSISSSLKSCIELKEFRLAHNDIKAIPAELARNTRLQNLDLGNNSITGWSDLKVLSLLVNLKNLNLQGNPIAENEKLAKKVKKLVPNLQIFNGRPLHKYTKNETDDMKNNFEHYEMSSSKDGQRDSSGGLEIDKGLKRKKKRSIEPFKEKGSEQKENTMITEELKKKVKKVKQNEVNDIDDKEAPFIEKELKHKKQKTNELSKDKASAFKEDSTITEKQLKRKSKKVQQNNVNVIDDAETPFMELFAGDMTGNDENGAKEQRNEKSIRDVSMIDGSVSFTEKKKKSKSRVKGLSALDLSQTAEIGLGGPSTWDD